MICGVGAHFVVVMTAVAAVLRVVAVVIAANRHLRTEKAPVAVFLMQGNGCILVNVIRWFVSVFVIEI